jgi:hypothetical protein
MGALKSIWGWLDGKKTVIAALAGLALAWAQAKGYVGEESAVYLASALAVITGVAVGHKGFKATTKEEG